jgi:hypothetical protein
MRQPTIHQMREKKIIEERSRKSKGYSTLFQHNHNTQCQKGVCSSSFDGKGNVLAHGFFPNNDECLGIHYDKSENWYFGESRNTPDGQTNFYTVLLQEIGHTLGMNLLQIIIQLCASIIKVILIN